MSRNRHLWIVTLACAGIAACGGPSPTQAEDTSTQQWQVVKDASSVTFTALEQGSTFQGNFSEFGAQITFNPDQPTAGHIVGTVKTASVDAKDATRNSELPSPDWFDSTQYPEARFESTAITKAADGSYVAKGNLTIKGVTKNTTMPFTFSVAGSGKAKFTGKLTINRFDYHIGETISDPNFIGKDVDVTVALDLAQPKG